MRIGFQGRLVDEPQVRLGHIGCGGHSFRNLLPVYQFVPLRLAATCDLDAAKAAAYAQQFGAGPWYSDYREMIRREKPEAVVVCVGFDDCGRPLYPQIACECMKLGVHVFIEKPPAAATAQVEQMMRVSAETGKIVECGLKRMFFQMTSKARELIDDPAFGDPMVCLLQREEQVPTLEQLAAFGRGEPQGETARFLDHFCHPASVLLYLMGMPQRMIYHRAASGAAVVTFEYDNGRVGSMCFTHGGSGVAGGVERLTIIGTRCRTVVVENCRVLYFQGPVADEGKPAEPYGAKPSYFTGAVGTTTAQWEPEFQLGQLYSKGLFLLGYYDELLEFARAILERRPPRRGTLLQCWQVTEMFEKFRQGPGRMIDLRPGPDRP